MKGVEKRYPETRTKNRLRSSEPTGWHCPKIKNAIQPRRSRGFYVLASLGIKLLKLSHHLGLKVV
jgi:hypothetical protein